MTFVKINNHTSLGGSIPLLIPHSQEASVFCECGWLNGSAMVAYVQLHQMLMAGFIIQSKTIINYNSNGSLVLSSKLEPMKSTFYSNKIISLILIVSCLFGCGSNKTADKMKQVCFITENEEEISFDDLVKSRKRIILEQQQDSYLSEIQNVILYDDKFYVLDGRKKAVLVFDRNGKYIRQIGRTGRGPGELLLPRDFAIDKNSGTIEILDSQQNKVIKYTATGDFVAEKLLDGRYTAFYKLNNGSYLYEREISSVVRYSHGNYTIIDPDDKYLLLYESQDGIKKFFQISDQRMLDGTLRFNRNCFSTFNNGVLFWQFFDNSFYYIENDELVSEFIIDFKGRNIPADIMEQPFYVRLQLLGSPENHEKYRGLISNVIGHKSIIFFSYQSSTGAVFIAWDTETNMKWRIVDESLEIEEPALFKVSDHQFVSIGFSDFTMGLEPKVILTLYEL